MKDDGKFSKANDNNIICRGAVKRRDPNVTSTEESKFLSKKKSLALFTESQDFTIIDTARCTTVQTKR